MIVVEIRLVVDVDPVDLGTTVDDPDVLVAIDGLCEELARVVGGWGELTDISAACTLSTGWKERAR